MKKNLKVLISLSVLLTLIVLAFVLCKHFGLDNVATIQNIISGCGAWTWLAYLGIYVLLTIFLCFVPGTSMTLILVGVALFGANYKTFLLCFSGVVLSSVCLDIMGRFGGEKVIVFIVGEDDYNSATSLLRTKGTVYTPVMYLLPLFPDDAICMCVGALRVNFWVHLAEIMLCRGIGCATIVFGVSILPTDLVSGLENFDWAFINTHLWEYIEMITILTFWVVAMLFVARRIDKQLSNTESKFYKLLHNRRGRKEQENNNEKS